VSVKTVGDGIKTNLSNISGLRVFAPKELPGSLNEFPVALILHSGTSYQQTMGGDSSYDTHRFRILIAVSNQDQPSALTALLDYLDKTGDKSVRASLEADPTLDGSAQDIVIISNTGQGGFSWGGMLYLGTTFELEVYE